MDTFIFSLTTWIIKKLLSITRNKKKKHDKILMLAKSKLNSIEILVSQTLIDMEITHEELNVIIREKQKYDRMKENVRNVSEKQENMRSNSVNSRKITSLWIIYAIDNLNWLKDVSELSEKQSKIIKHLLHEKFLFFCACIKWSHLALRHGVKLVKK